ncbi:MAG TPA: ChaN family lipoprotein [Spirochaetota bacterium]|nr:ChaN family lipoprotein [Spirochaetota bacterium]
MRCALWLDVYTGEPVSFDSMIEDCLKADVIYIGERHGLKRHHDMQRSFVEALAAKGRTLLLGIEQMESHYQPALDRFNRGEIDFDRLAADTDWERRWSNYLDYRAVLEACREAGGSVLALNARAEVVRAVARAGLCALDERERAELPAEIDLENEEHKRLLGMMLPVHAFTSGEGLRRMYEAQVARDEKMADILSERLLKENAAGNNSIIVVIAGAAHFAYGLGVPSRVGRRVPGIRGRIIILSESGDLRPGERERMMARDTGITHEGLKFISKPIADYIHITERAK